MLTWVSRQQIALRADRREVLLAPTSNCSRPELIEVLDLGARGMLRPKVTTFALEQATDAYRQLVAGQLNERAVIVPAAH